MGPKLIAYSEFLGGASGPYEDTEAGNAAFPANYRSAAVLPAGEGHEREIVRRFDSAARFTGNAAESVWHQPEIIELVERGWVSA